MHMVPVHQWSMAPGYSLSPDLHTQPSSPAVTGAISLPILGVPLRVPPGFGEPVNQPESEMSWRLAEPVHHPPATSSPCTPAFTTTGTGGVEVLWPPPGATGSVAPAPPWPHAMVSVSTHQTSSKIKPQYTGLRRHYWQGVEQDKLCKNLHASKKMPEEIQLLFGLSAACRTDFEQSTPKEISCVPLKSRGQERLNSSVRLWIITSN